MCDVKYIPSIIVNSLGASLIVTLGSAYYYEHITYVVPYISDSGTFPPESCIFGQVLNIISVLIAYALYVRYLQIKEIINDHDENLQNWNKINLFVGFGAAIGVMIVANFQETNMFIVHWVGATLAFGGGSLYQIVQNIILMKEESIFSDFLIRCLQKVTTVLSTIAFVIFFAAAMVANSKFEGKDMTKWKHEDGGFVIHNVSSIAEWICASSIMAFIFLLTWEFKKITVEGISVQLKTWNKHGRRGSDTTSSNL